MSAKGILLVCAQAFLIKVVISQCSSRAAVDASRAGPYSWSGPGLPGSGLAYDGRAGWAGRGLGGDGIYSPAMEFTATSGGSLPVTSTSAIAPTGISVVSENVFEGALSVAGELPFVGTTGMEGAMPSGGAGAINHACGDGVTAMVSEGTAAPAAALAPAAAISPAAYPSAAGGFGIGTGLGRAAGFGPAGIAASGFGPANRLGLGGCGRGIMY